MSKPRFSLLLLLGAVAVVGAMCVALRSRTLVCASVTLSTAYCVLIASLVIATTCRGAMRVFWLSFAIVGWSHLLLALTPWFAEGTSDVMFSRYCLDWLARPLGHKIYYSNDMHFPLKAAAAYTEEGGDFYRYSKYLVIGQSIITVWLAAIGGGHHLYMWQTRIERREETIGT